MSKLYIIRDYYQYLNTYVLTRTPKDYIFEEYVWCEDKKYAMKFEKKYMADAIAKYIGKGSKVELYEQEN